MIQQGQTLCLLPAYVSCMHMQADHAAISMGMTFPGFALQLQPPCKETAARMGAIVTEDVNSVIPFTIIVESPHLEGHAGDEASLSVSTEHTTISCNVCSCMRRACSMQGT